MKKSLLPLLIALIALVACQGTALAQCSLSANITSAMTTDPALPTWEYTISFIWDTGSVNGLSHLDLIIDPLAQACLCADMELALFFVEPAGESLGEGGCTVQWGTEVGCVGDPSIPGVTGTILKWEPLRGGPCELDVAGTVSLVFYSDHDPYPIDADAIALVDKFALNYCFGTVTGVFPALACDSVPNETGTWGGLMGLYL